MQTDTILKQETPGQLFLNKLRQRTAYAHSRLEQLPLSANLTSAVPNMAEYVCYLEVMYKVVSDVERSIFPLVANELPDLQHRVKAQWLADDLAAMNGKAEEEHLFGTIGDQEHTVPFAMGIMYVIEGSTLGGRVIVKNIQPMLDAAGSGGYRYFAGYEEDTGTRWTTFLQSLTAFATANNDAEEEVIAGAIYAFDIIHNQIKAAGNNEDN